VRDGAVDMPKYIGDQSRRFLILFRRMKNISRFKRILANQMFLPSITSNLLYCSWYGPIISTEAKGSNREKLENKHTECPAFCAHVYGKV